MTHKQTTAARKVVVFEKRDFFERKKEKSGRHITKISKRTLCIRYHTHDYTHKKKKNKTSYYER